MQSRTQRHGANVATVRSCRHTVYSSAWQVVGCQLPMFASMINEAHCEVFVYRAASSATHR
jgi:hypothetical protein